MKIGCGILVFLSLFGCAVTDHSRNFPQDITVEPGGLLLMSVVVMVEKEGTETSSADAKSDAALSVPFVP